MKEWTVRESCEGRIALNLRVSTVLATIRCFFIRLWAKLSAKSIEKPKQQLAIGEKR